MMHNRYHRRSKKEMVGDIPLTPLIDTALTLLIIFMLASPAMHNAIKINLPKGTVQENKGLTNDIVIVVDKEQKLYLKQQQMELVNLLENIATEIKKYKHGTVHIHADSTVSYGYIVMLIDQLKNIQGIQHLMLVTEGNTNISAM